MFEPTLFGVSTTQLWEIFKLLFLPTIGFAFLFLLGLPLKKIPALADLEGYTPPRWLLPTFSCSSAFALSLLAGSLVALQIPEPFDPKHIVSTYAVEHPIRVPNRITKFIIRIANYDGYSNFRVSINGYTVIDSEQHCALTYQCEGPGHVPLYGPDGEKFDPRRIVDKYATEHKIRLQEDDRKPASLHYVGKTYTIPFDRDAARLLVRGENVVDIESANSGTKECLLDVDLVLGSTEATRMYRLHVDERDWSLESWQGSLRRRPNVVDRGQPSFEAAQPEILSKKFRENHHPYSLCHRGRLIFDALDLATSEEQLIESVKQAAEAEFCDVFLDAPKYCVGRFGYEK